MKFDAQDMADLFGANYMTELVALMQSARDNQELLAPNCMPADDAHMRWGDSHEPTHGHIDVCSAWARAADDLEEGDQGVELARVDAYRHGERVRDGDTFGDRNLLAENVEPVSEENMREILSDIDRRTGLYHNPREDVGGL